MCQSTRSQIQLVASLLIATGILMAGPQAEAATEGAYCYEMIWLGFSPSVEVPGGDVERPDDIGEEE
jgi:hypothetical protein